MAALLILLAGMIAFAPLLVWMRSRRCLTMRRRLDLAAGSARTKQHPEEPEMRLQVRASMAPDFLPALE